MAARTHGWLNHRWLFWKTGAQARRRLARRAVHELPVASATGPEIALNKPGGRHNREQMCRRNICRPPGLRVSQFVSGG